MKVGFIGLGSQGGPMARRIAEEGYDTTLWARRPETLDPFADTGARLAPSRRELAADADLVCVCVVDHAGVLDVALGDDGVLGAMAPGSILAVHSTVRPDTCATLAGAAAARGVTIVDAPVSGGGIAAAARTLLVMVGAEASAFERCLPVFQTYGDPVVHVGPVGAGQLAKLVNNIVWTSQCGIAADALTLAGGLGIDRAAMGAVLRSGSARSYAHEIVGQGGISMVGLAGPLLRKDTDAIVRVAQEARADLGGLSVAAERALHLMGDPEPAT